MHELKNWENDELNSLNPTIVDILVKEVPYMNFLPE